MARTKAEGFGKKTEDALKEVGGSVNAFFRGAEESFQSIIRPGWWGAANGQPGSGCAAPAAGAPQAPFGTASSAAGVPAFAPTSRAPAAAESPCAQPPKAEDDAAMRRHFAALERLVEIGLSPQAARVALRHLDLWLVGLDGEAEMTAAEAAADAAGEVILHVGDRVRLEGLLKNTAVNGKVGVLQAYGADSLRWKVALSDGQVFWVRPQLIKPVELRRQPLPPLPTGAAPPAAWPGRSEAGTASALAAGLAGLEERQARWREEQEAREIELLEREETLRKVQEAIEVEQHTLSKRKHLLAMDQARSISQLERAAAAAGASPEGRAAAKFVLGGVSPSDSRTPTPQDTVVDADEVEAEADEMWDMDWAAVVPSADAGAGRVCLPAAEAPAPRSPSAASSGSGPSPGSQLPGAVPREAHPARSPRSPRARSPPRAACPGGPEVPPSWGINGAEKEVLQQKLEEKRLLAELHNGEDLTLAPPSEFIKGRMPGVHPAIAEKLEERRRKLELEELGATSAPVAA